ncbi:uncharacterized protein [Physcomitrium patens]|nr:nuclear pore complex protein DDB_G0274915-like isoform X3 [Physcomitrium patens]|eukprot:XP_024370390.1 nuclear pore complex protein DDB_G0274915-like isoform X3 [Physcomitrella patens]
MMSPSAAEAESMEAGSQHGDEDNSSEVESWIRRTFPGEEADRLIASLRSFKQTGAAEEQVDHVSKEPKTANVNQVPALESAPSSGQLSDAQRWREERTKARQEQKSSLWLGGSGKENGTRAGPGTFEIGETVAVDVARAYMGERVTRVVTPVREKVPTPIRHSPYQPSPYLARKQQSNNFSAQYESATVPNTFGLLSPGGIRSRDGVFDDNLRTPPVTRTVGHLQPVPRATAVSSAIGYPLPGEGSKKRSFSAVEDGGYSTGGAIRRLRPRSSLYSPGPGTGFQRRGGLGMYPPLPRILHTPVDVKQKSITMWNQNADTEEKGDVKNVLKHKEGSKGLAMGMNAAVPERASATARKILETLDIMTPPKEKSLESELALVRDRPSTELTTSMMNDKARQTMQSWDYAGPQEEAGPSGRGRNLENDLSSAAGVSRIGAGHGTKTRGKGKASASIPSHNFEEKSTDQTSFYFQDASRLKVSESSLANSSPALGRNKGFQINADVDDSDEESRGANSTLVTSTVTTFSDGKSTCASGGFTFQSSNSFGIAMEPPPTPKPFPSPSSTGPAPKLNGQPTFKFNTGTPADNIVFKLPTSGSGGVDNNVHTKDMKLNYQSDNKPDSSPSNVTARETSEPAQEVKGGTSTLSSSSPETSPSAVSLANFETSRAEAKPASAGMFGSSSQTTGFSTGNSSGATLVSNKESSVFSFGKSAASPSAEPATQTSPTAGSGMFGSNGTSSATTFTSPAPAFGSSSAFGMNKGSSLFGAAGSSSAAPTLQSTAPAVTLDDGNKSQKVALGQSPEKANDGSVTAPVTFGLSAAATTSASTPSTHVFSTPTFGVGASSPAPASKSAPLFGLKPASLDSTPVASTTSPSSVSAGFGLSSSLFGSSTFGSSNPAPLFGGASSAPAFGASSTPAFGASSTPAFGASSIPTFGASSTPAFGPSSTATFSTSSASAFGTSSTPAFGASSTPAFGASSTPAFGASSTPAFGASSTPAFGASSTPAFGASSTPAFGASSTPAFGASSTPAFGASSTPAFGASSTPAFGASSTPAFGASSTPAFGASSTPAFGASSTPAFGASSTPAFGASSTPAFGASSTPAFGASSTPAFGASSTPAFGVSNAPNTSGFGGFSSEVSAQPSQSPPVFGFGASGNAGSSSSPASFAFGASAGSGNPFAFGASTGASPTTSTGAFAFGASSAASPTTSTGAFAFGSSSAASPTTSTGAFAFGASSAASPTTSTGAFAFGGSSAASSSPFSFGAKPSSPSMFGTSGTAPAFGSSPNGGMGTDMEDNMADDGQMMASSPPPQQQSLAFGASQNPFGKPSTPVTTPSSVFGGFGSSTAPAGANPFAPSPQQPSPAAANPFAQSPQPGQPLNFGGGGFALGTTGQDSGAKPNRKFIKAKRAGSVKRK